MTSFQAGFLKAPSIADFIGLAEAAARREQQGELDRAQMGLYQERLGLDRDRENRFIEQERTQQAQIKAQQDALARFTESMGLPPVDPNLDPAFQAKQIEQAEMQVGFNKLKAIDDFRSKLEPTDPKRAEVERNAIETIARYNLPRDLSKRYEPQKPKLPEPNMAALIASIKAAKTPEQKSAARVAFHTAVAPYLVDNYGFSATDALRQSEGMVDSIDPPVQKQDKPSESDIDRLIDREMGTLPEKLKFAETEYERLRSELVSRYGAGSQKIVEALANAPETRALQDARSQFIQRKEQVLAKYGAGGGIGQASSQPAPQAMTDSQVEDATVEFIIKNPNATDAEIAAYTESLKAR